MMFVRPKSGNEPTIACPSMCALLAAGCGRNIGEYMMNCQLKTSGAARGAVVILLMGRHLERMNIHHITDTAYLLY